MKSPTELRAAPRFALSADLRYLLRGESEGAGRLLDISERGLAMVANSDAREGDDIVVYVDTIGRLPGRVVRKFCGGLGVAFDLAASQRDRIGARILAALRGAPYLRLVEQRSTIRVRYNIQTIARVIGEETPIDCTIIDMSRTGCLLRSTAKPRIGAKVELGSLHGLVCRHSSDGFAVDFARAGQAIRGAIAHAGAAS